MLRDTEHLSDRTSSDLRPRTRHDRGATRATAAIAAVVGLVVLAACEQVDRIQERFRASTAHEAYERALAGAGLAETALARDWIDAARRSLAEPTRVDVPYRETGYLPPERPTALGYRLEIARGQRFVAELRLETGDAAEAVAGSGGLEAEGGGRTGAGPGGAVADAAGGAAPDARGGSTAGGAILRARSAEGPVVFVDLYRLGGDSATVPYHEASADSGALRLEHEPWRGGEFVLRIQPELLRGGRYTLTIFNAASLAFPVDGASTRNIRSVFGDPREGGRREHHGVDIFARRGTPVMAAAPGRVRGVRTTPLGGRVVWLRDERRGQSFYYAHLDSQLVRGGMRVRAGDTLGLVGNSGNARTTPPHLHFGIYRRGQGPVDPFPFLYRTDTVPDPVRVDDALVGAWARAAADRARLRASPGTRAPIVDELPARTALRVVAATGDWYRVELPDGRGGYLFGRLAESIDGAIAERVVASPAGIHARPVAGAPVIDSIAGDSPVPVLGRFGEFLLVRAPAGFTGWLAANAGGTVGESGTPAAGEPAADAPAPES